MRKKLLLVGLLSILGLTTPGCRQTQDKQSKNKTEAKAEIDKQDGLEILRGFLGRSPSTAAHLKELSLATNGQEKQSGLSRFSAHNGWTIGFVFSGFETEVSLQYRMVVSFRELETLETAAPGADENIDKQPDEDSRRRVNANERALSIARQFILDHEGQDFFDRMTMVVGKRVVGKMKGQRFVFVWWSAEKDQVRVGSEHVEIGVDAKSGRVDRYWRDGCPISGKPILSYLMARRLALEFLRAAEVDAEIQQLTYLEPPLRSGGFSRVWAVRYRRQVCGPIVSIDDLFIDAKTREIVPDPGLLNDPEMAVLLEEQKARIREISKKMSDSG